MTEATEATQLSPIEALIVRTIYEKQGMKIMELIPVVVKEACTNPDDYKGWDNTELPELIEKMIQQGRIKEVEYCVPQLPNRIKSFLLPSEARVRITQAGIADGEWL